MGSRYGVVVRGMLLARDFYTSWYVVCYLREIFTLQVENEPVNPGRGRRTRVEGGELFLCDYAA
jgi:hypothetical protein